MPRPPRVDEPGCLFHVMNRGLARRSVFETRADVRVFLSLMARAVQRRLIEVVAYSVLTNHFHVLVRSVAQTLSEAMHDVLAAYAQYFNRTRERDGPLFKGRFVSVPIRSDRQLHYTLRYIDANPVDAGIVEVAERYPYGSAGAHAGLVRRPRWLDGRVIDAILFPLLRSGNPRADAYRTAFPPIPPDLWDLVRARLRPRRRDVPMDPLDLDDPGLVAWMQERATLADGTRVGRPHVEASRLLAAVEAGRAQHPNRVAWDVLLVGLLRGLAGLRLADVAVHVHRALSTLSRMETRHRATLSKDPAYRDAVVEMVRAAEKRCLAPFFRPR